MSTELIDLVKYLDQCLQPDSFADYCPNGLQVEGRATVAKLVSGVTASQALLDAAIAWGADAILVHHGYFWRTEDMRVVGMKRRRLATLLAHDVSLLAYHLPLDAHPTYGNNAQLGVLLGFDAQTFEPLAKESGGSIGNVVDLATAVSAGNLVAQVTDRLGREALHIGDGADSIQRVAWCTGAAQGYIEAAIAAGADMFISGEISEQTVHVAREEGIHYVAAGHHATERYGARALGEHLAETFSLEHRFIDIDNPV